MRCFKLHSFAGWGVILWQHNCQTAFSRWTPSGGPFKTSQVCMLWRWAFFVSVPIALVHPRRLCTCKLWPWFAPIAYSVKVLQRVWQACSTSWASCVWGLHAVSHTWCFPCHFSFLTLGVSQCLSPYLWCSTPNSDHKNSEFTAQDLFRRLRGPGTFLLVVKAVICSKGWARLDANLAMQTGCIMTRFDMMTRWHPLVSVLASCYYFHYHYYNYYYYDN